MAVIKVFDCNGTKELKCFDTVSSVPYMVDEEPVEDTEPKENNPFE